MIELPDFASVRPTVLNWVIVGLMAITFIALMKFAVNRYDNPLLAKVKDLVNAA